MSIDHTKSSSSANALSDSPPLGFDQLEILAHNLAQQHSSVSRRYGRKPTLLDRLKGHEVDLQATYKKFASTSISEFAITQAGEWLLDNNYIIQDSIRHIREDMPDGFYRQLPKLNDGSHEGYPRIYSLAYTLVHNRDTQIEPETIQRFIAAYQAINPLTLGELWAFPVMLRIAVIEDLSKAVTQVTGDDSASSLIDSNATPETLDQNNGAIVGNAILNLRALAIQDWKSIVENLSRVERTLRRDPAGNYSFMDFETRNSYRRIIEKIALATGRDEEEIAGEAIALAEEQRKLLSSIPLAQEEETALGLASPETTPRTQVSLLSGSSKVSHVGYYLIDSGLDQLKERLGLKPSRWERFKDWISDRPILPYLSSIGLLTWLFILGIVFFVLPSSTRLIIRLIVMLLTLVPALSVSVNIVNWTITRRIPVTRLPKMDFQSGIPKQYSTMVVIPAMLSSSAEIRSLLEQLEIHYLSNPDRNLYFALLTDYIDAPQMDMPDDAALLKLATEGIQDLNKRYPISKGCRFSLFHRRRIWNSSEERWMGWERKRGKLSEFNHLLNGSESTTYEAIICPHEILPQIRYVITLDGDTVLPEGNARRLVGTFAHPLNQAEFHLDTGGVVSGYTILQPRVEIKPTSANQTLFTRIFSGDIALDLYSRAASDVYQDLFFEGIYVGKGIYDVAAFERSLHRRIPDNTLLSHDLFEGIHGRAALVTDITLLEDFPPLYLAFARRLHRWVRGDWQLLPWLMPRVPRAGGRNLPNRLSLLNRWKIIDNLRRSLLMPSLLVLLVVGWTFLPGSAWLWSLISVLVLGIPFLTSVGNRLDNLFSRIFQGDLRGLKSSSDFWRWFLAITFLPFEALLSIDAIFSTLFRLTVTRQRMLQWTTSAESARQLGERVKPQIILRQMASSLIFTSLIGFLVWQVNPTALPSALPLLLLWLLSPQIAHWISQPRTPRSALLAQEDRDQLRGIARRTWLFFEEFVGPEDQWLPPDHFQEDPLGLVAHRTSPTNIGLMLLSSLSAFDLGYLGISELTLRLSATFDTLQRLERHRGHLLNWYGTHDLKPLTPRYVSTVDNGNLAACFVVLKQATLEFPQSAVLGWERWEGLLDALSFLDQIVEGLDLKEPSTSKKPINKIVANFRQRIFAIRDAPEQWGKLWFDLTERGWDELNESLKSLIEKEGGNLEAPIVGDLRICTDLVHVHLFRVQREIDMLLPWLTALNHAPPYFENGNVADEGKRLWAALKAGFPITPNLEELPTICRNGKDRLDAMQAFLETATHDSEEWNQAKKWCIWLTDALVAACEEAERLMQSIEDIADRAEHEIQKMDFGFLFNKQRQVFHIGYHVDNGRLDANFYDLLASEARLASLVAMAKRDIPQTHWLHLGRPLTLINGMRVLLSWSGTMFEYLMPNLLVKDYEGTLLSQSGISAVDRQIAYGRLNDTPWGVSESGYYAFDANMFYQYRAFGVPPLGFKRGLDEDLVVTPYASILGLALRPKNVMRNIDRFINLDMMGRYGFFESLDFTKSRLSFGTRHSRVRSYMAHHQGMIMLAIANYLQDDRMIRRFHSDARIKGIELLLQERVPQEATIVEAHQAQVSAARPSKSTSRTVPWQVPIHDPVPQVHLLSNGYYSVMLTSSGGGFSRWRDIDLTRWRADTTLENWGSWFYVQDRQSGELWSAGFQPTSRPPDTQSVTFEAHKAEYWRQDGDVSTRMEVAIAPEEDVEIRRISVTNHGGEPRQLLLSSYAEVILAEQAADRRHPAFNKIFIESEYLPELNTLLFRRRPRSSQESTVYLAHFLIREQGRPLSKLYEADRAKFLGRGRGLHSPGALDIDGEGLTGTIGATLDSVMALGQEIDVKPGATEQLAWITLIASSKKEAITLVERFRSWSTVSRTFDRSKSQIDFDLRQDGYTTPELENINRMLSALSYPHQSLRAEHQILRANRKGQSSLWPYTVSGDFPILLVKIEGEEQTQIVLDALRAHAYWRKRQIKIDLVILNQREVGYSQDLNNQIFRLVSRMDSEAWLNRRGGIFLLREDQMSREDKILLETAAGVILRGDGGNLRQQLEDRHSQRARLPYLDPTLPASLDDDQKQAIARPEGLLFDNGIGGFSQDGREYMIYLEPGQHTPAPWINVIANKEFGFFVSELGAGCTWAGNSGENRLTPWRNDPVSDPPSEVLYLRDEETGEIWTPTPNPVRAQTPYLIRHGAGYTIFEHHSHNLKQHLRLFTAPEEPIKIIQLKLTNTTDRPRRITATYFADWVLGTDRDQNQAYIIPQFDSQTQALLAHNPYNAEFGERMAFLAGSKAVHGLTNDRAEFLGRLGRFDHPAALELVGLSGTLEVGVDPCATIMLHLDLDPYESEEIYFLLGQENDRRSALKLIERYQKPGQVKQAWQKVHEIWDQRLDSVQVKTPEPSMDLLLNRWLLYQSLACRVWGRTAFYQSSGAFGFRDQLQDVMAFVHSDPDLVREHILESAKHQFEEGDVLHWWHPPSSRGVRTRITDDLLWLPFVTAHYVSATNDQSILSEEVPFLTADPLGSDEEERYGLYNPSELSFSLYEHCVRAIQHGLTSGLHGLPLMGAGDWNDGMNRIGIEGKGESVWLGWFIYATLNRFAPLCELMGDSQQAESYLEQAESLRASLEEEAWDGEWYRRAYYDDGTPVGSAESIENQIDSIAQSWAVLSHGADPIRASKSIDAVLERLVRHDDGIMLLFTPPFDKTPHDPGYIKGYPPGIRENGGQYTHGVQWVIWALAELGRGEEAENLFRLLNPINHGQNPEKYRVEPYVIAADVSSTPPHNGRGGWTWYTGSAAWFYRLGLEGILGLRRKGEGFTIDPRIPPAWPGFEITYRWGNARYHITVDNAQSVSSGIQEIVLDGHVLDEKLILLKDDGEDHEVRVLMGREDPVSMSAETGD
jgi:cyclic beta-1,2-glucan synthetase